jgi:hypothetical protein
MISASGLWWVCTAKCCICFEHIHLTAHHDRMVLSTKYTNLMAKGITADVMHVKQSDYNENALHRINNQQDAIL